MLIAKNDLARLLGSVIKAVETRNTIPILGTVRLVADGTALTATGTDLDLEVSGSIPATGTLSACVDAKLLSGIVSKAGAEISMEIENLALVVKSGRSRFRLPVLSPDDFPSFNHGDFPVTFEADLAALFAPVAFAISTEETRHYLNGIYLEPAAATATDGHRLAHAKADLPVFQPIIVPRKTVGILPKGLVTVSLSTTKIRVSSGDTNSGGGFTLTSKLIDGTYPDYQRVIPTQNDKIVLVDRAALAGAVARVATVSGERGRAVKLEVAPGAINLSVRGDAEATDSVEADYSGEPIEIGFNAAYLSELLANLTGETVRIALADGGSPTLFTGGDENLLAVCMPMRV